MQFTLIVLLTICSLVSGQLFAVAPTEPMTLVSIDPTTGVSTTIGQPIAGLFPEEGGVIDPASKTLYALGVSEGSSQTYLIGIDLATGGATKIALPFAGQQLAIYVNINTNTGHLIVTGAVTNNRYEMYDIDPATSQSTFITKFFTQGGKLAGGWSAYDSKRNVEWLQIVGNITGQIVVVGFDISNGQMVYNFIDQNTEGLQYDPVTNLLWGWSLTVYTENNGSFAFNRTLAYLDPSKGIVSTGFSPKPYTELYVNSLSAFNPTTRVYYTVLTLPDDEMSAHLVSFNIATGQLLNSPFLCNITAAPWVMGYLP